MRLLVQDSHQGIVVSEGNRGLRRNGRVTTELTSWKQPRCWQTVVSMGGAINSPGR